MIKRLAQMVLVLGAAGCLDSEADGKEGAACVRLAQCAPGLACVEGICSSDLAALAEAGVVPVLDAGAMFDAVVIDAPVSDEDGGN